MQKLYHFRATPGKLPHAETKRKAPVKTFLPKKRVVVKSVDGKDVEIIVHNCVYIYIYTLIVIHLKSMYGTNKKGW